MSDDEQYESVFEARRRGGVEAVGELLRSGVSANARGQWRQTPLMVAAWGGNTEMVRALLEAGADPNAQDDTGSTALVHAMETRCTEDLVRALIDAGADVNLNG